MARPVMLGPVEESELALLTRLLWDPAAPGEYQWFGFRMGTAREIERRWHDDGLIGEPPSFLAVRLEDGTCAGWVTWRGVGASGNHEVGIALFPEHRGRGVGTEAQRQLVDLLFSTTTANRLQAGAEVDNVAEQRALERAGFRREGVHRGVHFRAGRWRDSIMYGLLRDDERGSAPAERSDMIEKSVADWHRYLRGQLPGGLDELLHDDVVFYSPIVYTPQEGKAITKLYLEAARQTLPGDRPRADGDDAPGGFRYTKEVLAEHVAVLEFESTVEGKYVNGVDIIRCDDDGRIVEFRVMIRPLQAVNLVHRQMAAMLDSMTPTD